MNLTYTLFNRDGSVSQVVTGPLRFVIAPTLSNWEGYHFEGEYDGTYYFHDGEPKKRPDCPTYLDGMVLREVLAGSVITIDDEEYPVSEAQDVTLSFPFEGKYLVKVTPPFPYLEKEFTIDYQP